MAEYPALPLFTDAFLADTMHLTSAQIGAYLLMLMTAWRTSDCKLSNDDAYLARICRMDKRTWAANKEIILAFWQHTSDAKLFQKRLSDERNYVEGKRNKNVRAGKASALKRKKRHSTDVVTEALPEPNQPTPTPILSKEDKSSSDNLIIIPTYIDHLLWNDFMKIRKTKKAIQSERAINSILNDLEKWRMNGHDPNKIIEKSIRNSWKDVFEPKEINYGNKGQEQKSNRRESLEQFAKIIHHRVTQPDENQQEFRIEEQADVFAG